MACHWTTKTECEMALQCCIILMFATLASAQVLVNFTQVAPPPENNVSNVTNGNCSKLPPGLTCKGSYLLTNKDYGPLQGYNDSRAFVWRQSFNMAFILSPPTNVSQVTLFFANQPLSGIGLPEIGGVFCNASALNFSIAGNQALSQNDTGLRNVSIIIVSVVNRCSNLSISFSFTSSILVRTLYLSEVQLGNAAVLRPLEGNISFLSQSRVITTALPNYNISCTVMNEGYFEWNWTLPLPVQYQVWIADGTRTSVLQLSNITSNYSGNYVCRVKYKSQTAFVAKSIMLNITSTNTALIQPGSTFSTAIIQPGSTFSTAIIQPGSTFSTIFRAGPASTPTGSPSQEATTGPLTAGIVVGIIMTIAIITVLVALFAFIYCTRYKKKDSWIAEKTFRTNDTNVSEANEPDQSLYTKVETNKPSTISAWKEHQQPQFEDTATDGVSSDHQNRGLIGPSKAGKLAPITDVSGFIFVTNALFEADEDEHPYTSITTKAPSRSKKVPIKRIKPVDIQYEMGSVNATMPTQNLIAIPEVISPSSPSEQVVERRRCLTGPSKPGKLATTSEAVLLNMNWCYNVLYGSSEHNINNPPPLDNDLLNNPDPIYSVALDLSPTQECDPVVSMEGSAEHRHSAIYANLSDYRKPPAISPENICEIEFLGDGQYGEVVLAELVDVTLEQIGISADDSNNHGKNRVSVKRLKEEYLRDAFEDFKKEIKFMSLLNHENVVRLLAVHEGSENSVPFIVMEYMENGDLCKFLQNHHLSSVEESLSPSVLLYMAIQIANGMRYLATFNFVHRDLATRNCLVGQNYIVKISDFGMTANLYEAAYCRIHGQARLPIRWMPTESFYGQFSEKSDIWAFGVVMWEIYSLAQALPYADMEDEALIEDATLGRARKLLTRPDLCPAEVYNVMILCWSYELDDRPTFEEVYQALLNCQN